MTTPAITTTTTTTTSKVTPAKPQPPKGPTEPTTWVPESCCKNDTKSEYKPDNPLCGMLSVKEENLKDYIYMDGCSKKVKDSLRENLGKVAGIV